MNALEHESDLETKTGSGSAVIPGRNPLQAEATPSGSAGGVLRRTEEHQFDRMGLSWRPRTICGSCRTWNIAGVDRLNAAGTTQIGRRFHAIALRSQMAF